MRWTSVFFDVVAGLRLRGRPRGEERCNGWKRRRAASFRPCRLEASARPVPWPTRMPGADEALVVLLGLPGDLHLLFPQGLDVVCVGRSAPVPLLRRPAGLQLHGAQLVGNECWARPEVVLLLGQHVPAQDGQLARDGNSGDLVPAAGADADEEGVQRAGGYCDRPGDLHQHRPGVAAADLADPPVVSGTEPRLAHTRVETEVAHQSFCGLGKRAISPIAAISPTATVRLTPVIVISRLIAASSSALSAISRFRRSITSDGNRSDKPWGWSGCTQSRGTEDGRIPSRGGFLSPSARVISS